MPKRWTEIRYNLPCLCDPEEGSEPDSVAYALSFSVVPVFLIVQINNFRQAQVTLQLRVSLSDLVYSFLTGTALLVGGVRIFFFFCRDLNPLTATLALALSVLYFI